MGGSFFDAAIARGENRGYERGIQRGVQQGVQQGIEQGLLFSAQRLIKKEGWPFDRAMALLDVPQEQWKDYAAQMEQKSD